MKRKYVSDNGENFPIISLKSRINTSGFWVLYYFRKLNKCRSLIETIITKQSLSVF